MGKPKKVYAPSVPIEPFFRAQMRDPEFKRAYDELEPEFEVIRQVIELRIKRNLSQAELARRIGTKQPSIARLESQKRIRNLDYLQRVANALDADVQVRIVPRTASGARNRRGGKKV